MSTQGSVSGQHASVTDFYRSFLRFRIDLKITQPRTVSQPPPFTLNNARFPLESVLRLTQPAATGGKTTQYVLGSSCKAEQVHVTENVWHDPAADMCLVASPEEFLVIKSWDRNHRGVMLSPPTLGEQPERQVGRCSEAFTALNLTHKVADARLLTSTEEIVDAVLNDRPLVSQTEYALENGTHVFLEYPVKVVNASERELFYQVDTGPVLIPDVTSFDGVHEISMLRQAFMAHNTLNCTEMLMNVPTAIGGGLSVNHYARVVKVQAIKRMFDLD